MIDSALLCSTRPELHIETQPVSLAVALGPGGAQTACLVIKKAVSLRTGDLVSFVCEGQASIYVYPYTGAIYSHDIVMTNSVIVFRPGYEPPVTYPLNIGFPGGELASPGIGMDLKVASNYYYPAVRAGAYKALANGVHTFAHYWWGGAVGGVAGMAATVFPNTPQITLIVHRAAA